MAKTINTRVQLKHDIETNWNKATNFIPLAGEVIIYDRDDNYEYERIKIGDGITVVSELPFFVSLAPEEKPQWTTPEVGMSITALSFVGNEVMYDFMVFDIEVESESTLAIALGAAEGTLKFMFSGPSVDELYPGFQIEGTEYSSEITSHTPIISLNTNWPQYGSWSELGIISMTIVSMPEDIETQVQVLPVITSGAVDSELSETSTNPVQNKVITKEINNIKEILDKDASKGTPWDKNLNTRVLILSNDLDTILTTLQSQGYSCDNNNGGFGDAEPYGMNWSNLNSVGLDPTQTYPLVCYQSYYAGSDSGAILAYSFENNGFVFLLGETPNDVAQYVTSPITIPEGGIVLYSTSPGCGSEPKGTSLNWNLVGKYFFSELAPTNPILIVQSDVPDASQYPVNTLWIDTSVTSAVNAEGVEF